jgi:hypothetical protein
MPFKCILKRKFQASRHKFLSQNLHSLDINGPIILLVESHKGKKFGGFSQIMFPKGD